MATNFKSQTYREQTKCGSLYITIDWESDGSVHRIAANLGKCGTCPAAHLSTVCALLTGVMQKCTQSDANIITGLASGHKCGGNASDQACCTDKLIRRVEVELEKERKHAKR